MTASNRCYTKSELAIAYRMKVRSLTKWMKNFGIETGKRKIVYPNELEQLSAIIGRPDLTLIN